MNFIETRGNDGQRPVEVTFSQAILSPMSSFGGLYVPKSLPKLGEDFLQVHLNSHYKELAKAILEAFEIDIDASVVQQALDLYDGFDDPEDPVPVVKLYEDLYISELYHGPTRAFKDMALQPFGLILSSLAQQRNEEYLILAATSGDTGPAALASFKNRDKVRVVCLYPDGGTSAVQRLQMVTEEGRNLKVIGIRGDFDDAQNALKTLLTSAQFNETLKQQHISLSAANSVNFGRIIFQIIYHIYSYLSLVRQGAIVLGEKVYLDVPSGNFGNALGAYYAMKMGLPVEQILIASNANNVLTRLIREGIYDLRQLEVIPTTSPAMDILKSSNIERVLFDLYGAERTRDLMQQLDQSHYYQLTAEELAQLQTIFAADYCEDEVGKSYIRRAFFEKSYLMDPHTATCLKPYETCRLKPELKTIAYSTAEWTKFSSMIVTTLTGRVDDDELETLYTVSRLAKLELPKQIQALIDLPVVQDMVIDKTEIESAIVEFLRN